MVSTVSAEDLFRFGADVVCVIYDMKTRLDFAEERQRIAVAPSIAQQGPCLTDDILGDIKTGFRRSGVFRKVVGLLVVDIALIEAGVEERCITEKTSRKRHQRLFA